MTTAGGGGTPGSTVAVGPGGTCVFCFNQISLSTLESPELPLPNPFVNQFKEDEDAGAQWKLTPVEIIDDYDDIDSNISLNPTAPGPLLVHQEPDHDPITLFKTMCSIFQLDPTNFPIESENELPICKPCLNGPILDLIDLHEKILELTNSLDKLKLELRIQSLIRHGAEEEESQLVSETAPDKNNSELFSRLWNAICADFLPRLMLDKLENGTQVDKQSYFLNFDQIAAARYRTRSSLRLDLKAFKISSINPNPVPDSICPDFINEVVIKEESSDEFILPNKPSGITRSKGSSRSRSRFNRGTRKPGNDSLKINAKKSVDLPSSARKRTMTRRRSNASGHESDKGNSSRKRQPKSPLQKIDHNTNPSKQDHSDGKSREELMEELFNTAPKKCRRVFFCRIDEEGNLWVKDYKMERTKEGFWYCNWCDKTVTTKPSAIYHLRWGHVQYKFKHVPRKIDGKTWIGDIELIHLEEFDVWSCGICDVKHSQKYGIIQHIQVVHFHENPKKFGSSLRDSKPRKRRRKLAPQEHEESRTSEGLIEDSNLDITKTIEKNLQEVEPVLTADTTEQSKEIISFTRVNIDGSDIFQCGKCSKGFLNRKAINKHIHQHNGIVDPISIQQAKPLDAPFLCGQCGKCFAQQSQLTKHEFKHAEAVYKCEVEGCDKAYRYPDHLRMHNEKIHLKIRNHVCPTCEFAFYSRCDLVNHQRTHTKELPYTCHKCGKKLRYTSSHGRHVAKCNGALGTNINAKSSNEDFEPEIDLVGVEAGTGTSSSIDYLTPMFNSNSVDFYTSTSVVPNYSS